MTTHRTRVGARASGASSALGSGVSEQSTRAASAGAGSRRGARAGAAGRAGGVAGAATGTSVVGTAATPAGAPLPGTAGAQSPQNIPALSAEAVAQAERDKKGETRGGFTRRNLPTGGYFNGAWYPAGDNREIPQAFADHLDASAKNPDASTEIGRETRFSGGKEDDHAEQGKAIAKLGEGRPEAHRKARQGAQFEAIARPDKGAKAGAVSGESSSSAAQSSARKSARSAGRKSARR